MGRAEELRDELKTATNVSTIQRMIDERRSESLWLDFKEASIDEKDGWKPDKPNRFGDGNYRLLAKALAGFANTHGGVIIWGVTCKPSQQEGDVPTGLKRVPKAAAFVSLLNSTVSRCTLPAFAESVECGWIPDTAEPDSGYPWIYIAQGSEKPYWDIAAQEYRYRSGSSFVKIPHDVLSGLFGRPPQPKLSLVFKRVRVTTNPSKFRFPGEPEGDCLIINWQAKLVNDGPGIARDFFIISDWANRDMAVTPLAEHNWIKSGNADSVSQGFALTCLPGARLVPRSTHDALKLEFRLRNSSEDSALLNIQFGADRTNLSRLQMEFTKQDLEDLKRAYNVGNPIVQEIEEILRKCLKEFEGEIEYIR